MDDGSPILGLLLIIVTLIIYMILFGFSSAIQSINEYDLTEKSYLGKKKAKSILKIIEDPGKFVNTVQIMSIVMLLVLGITALVTYAKIFTFFFYYVVKMGSSNLASLLGYLLTILILIIVLVSLGIVIPKKIASKHPEGWAYAMVYIVLFFMAISTPLHKLISFLSCIILKLFKVDFKDEDDEVTEEEIMSMVNEGHEQGTILASEAEMITNIFELGDKEAEDIMTNRKNIVAINGNWTLEETVKFIFEENNSRFPVYLDSIDNIIGILYFRDAVVFYDKEENRDKSVKDIVHIMRKAYFIPETRKIDIIFKDMQSEKIHMKIVIDEYGQTAGLITMEDILEEIVGNIFDEYDEIENNILFQEEGKYLLRGMTALEDIEDELGIDYRYHDYDTVNGLLISELGRIPTQEERPEIIVDGYTYKILGVENKMISQVLLTIPEDKKIDYEKEEV